MTPTRLTPLLVVATAIVLVPVLAGCTPVGDQIDELHRFAERVEQLPFVSDATVRTNQPLPFSLSSTMTIALKPETDRTAVDELHDVLCSADTRSTPAITLAYSFPGGAVLTQDGLGQCWTRPVAFVEALPVLAPHESQLAAVGWTEKTEPDDGDSLEIRIDLVDEPQRPGLDAAIAIAGELLTALDDDGSSVALAIPGLTIPDGPLAAARGTVALVADLASRYPVARVDAAPAPGLFVELSTEAPGTTDAVRAYLGSAYPDVAITAVVDSTAAVNGSPSQKMVDAGAAARESGLATAVRVGESRLSVSTTTMAANLGVLEALHKRGYGDVDVAYTTTLDSGALAVLTPGRTALDALQLADAETVVAALLPTGKLGQVSYKPGSLQVYLAAAVYDDASSTAQFTAILRETVENDLEAGLRFVELNNRPLDGG